MRTKINTQKVFDTLIDVVVVSAVVTFLWNLILPTAAGVSTISYWKGLGIVAHIFGIWHLFKSASKKMADQNEHSVEAIPLK